MEGRVVVLVLLVAGSASAGPVGYQGSWTRSASQNEDLVVRPMFMLRHEYSTVLGLGKFVDEVSSPGHSNYGAYLDMAGVKEHFPVAEGAEKAVLAFLAERGVELAKISVSASGDMIHAELPFSTAQAMFATEFHQYEHPQTKSRIVRAAAGYSMPAQIAQHVYLVGNLNEFPKVQRLLLVDATETNITWGTKFGSDCSGCSGRVTPGVLATRYGFNSSQLLGSAKDTGMATAEFQGTYYDNTSLNKFQSNCGLKQGVKVDHQVGNDYTWRCLTGGPCIEALLDIEYAKAVSGGIKLTNIYNDDYSMLNWAKQVDDLGDDGPSVHSISYGNDEVTQDDDAPSGMTGKAFMAASNMQFAKLAARGISVIVASGDQGVCGRSGCTKRFHPGFPASSPYVTAVGGTDFVTKNVIGEEQSWSNSGGGFSDEFAMPAWQQEAVKRYLTSAAKAGNLPSERFFNRSGRAYPDVAALGGEGNPFCIAAHNLPFVDTMQGVAGTSASCPVFAGLVARLNDARTSKGLPRMGLMNPWIYKHPEVFHDVTKGVNDGGSGFGSGNGFTAMSGWDPATGMGTPSFEKMLSAALVPEKTVVVV